ncbi:hypothetical protein RHIZ404_220505 [Rhizobium sp. EC-SD404]|nr:hypothetical protein RHIZ404_220505 [Rhizobium sp. EC-SD404]
MRSRASKRSSKRSARSATRPPGLAPTPLSANAAVAADGSERLKPRTYFALAVRPAHHEGRPADFTPASESATRLCGSDD